MAMSSIEFEKRYKADQSKCSTVHWSIAYEYIEWIEK